LSKKLPASIVYEDSEFLCFKDIAPKAPTHVILIPKIKGNLDKLENAEEKDEILLGKMLRKTK
jgi:diadenosine tetraphosphate (Ap4A) HIT family hydrolase